MGVGTLLVFIGVALLLGPAGPPLARRSAAGRAVRQRRGALARDNARRNPQRTASTAAALMIGLALVTLVATLAAGIISVPAPWTRSSSATTRSRPEQLQPGSHRRGRAAAEAPGVEAVASVRAGEAQVFGETELTTAVDRSGQVLRLDWVEGSQAAVGELGRDGAIVDDGFAEKHNLQVGSPVGDHSRRLARPRA